MLLRYAADSDDRDIERAEAGKDLDLLNLSPSPYLFLPRYGLMLAYGLAPTCLLTVRLFFVLNFLPEMSLSVLFSPPFRSWPLYTLRLVFTFGATVAVTGAARFFGFLVSVGRLILRIDRKSVV